MWAPTLLRQLCFRGAITYWPNCLLPTGTAIATAFPVALSLRAAVTIFGATLTQRLALLLLLFTPAYSIVAIQIRTAVVRLLALGSLCLALLY